MALKKSIEDGCGVAGEYWRVSRLEYMPKVYLRFALEQYLNADTRTAGKEPMGIKHYEVIAPQIEGCAVTYCYNQLKQGDFSDAIDC